jgi:hypothetical protein
LKTTWLTHSEEEEKRNKKRRMISSLPQKEVRTNTKLSYTMRSSLEFIQTKLTRINNGRFRDKILIMEELSQQ